jgi:hypothetical protein
MVLSHCDKGILSNIQESGEKSQIVLLVPWGFIVAAQAPGEK